MGCRNISEFYFPLYDNMYFLTFYDDYYYLCN